MLKDALDILNRSRSSLIEDALGVATLFSVLVAWLYLAPSVV